MVHRRTARMVWGAASGGERRRGVLAAFCAFAASLLPACSGCQVEIERSTTTHGDGLYRGLLVGGTEPDGPFVLAQRERAPGDEELVLVSLAEGEKRTCSLGKAFGYHTARPRGGYGDDGRSVDPRPARILALEGELGAKSGDLRIFDASCVELLRVPSVEAWPRTLYGDQLQHEGYAARTTSGKVVTIDPWSGSVHTISENASFWTYAYDKFWLFEGGSLVVRDRDGKPLQTAGSGVTELAFALLGEEVAYVDAEGLWVLKLGDPEPTAIPTAATPCKPEYFYTGSMQLAYRDDCAAGVLAVLDRTTGDTRVLSAGVTSARILGGSSMPWIFFEREEPGKERELWAVPGAGEPVLVGTNPRPNWYPGRSKAGFLIELDHDGAAGTLGTWTLEGGFSPLLENTAWSGGSYGDYLAAITDAQEDVGTLVVYDKTTMNEALRVPRVHRASPTFASQVLALGYIHDWDDALGAGTFGVWIPAVGQQIDVDTGVTEYVELFWPEPGILYAVRAPERAGLWTAYPDL